MTEDASLLDGPCLILDAVFSKNIGLAACIREQPCRVKWHTMTEQASLVEGACLVLDAAFSKNKGVGCMYSGAALSSRVAYHDRAGRSSRGGMSNTGCGFFKKQGGWLPVCGGSLVE